MSFPAQWRAVAWDEYAAAALNALLIANAARTYPTTNETAPSITKRAAAIADLMLEQRNQREF